MGMAAQARHLFEHDDRPAPRDVRRRGDNTLCVLVVAGTTFTATDRP